MFEVTDYRDSYLSTELRCKILFKKRITIRCKNDHNLEVYEEHLLRNSHLVYKTQQ